MKRWLITLVLVGLFAAAPMALAAADGPAQVNVHYAPALPPERGTMQQPLRHNFTKIVYPTPPETWSGSHGSLTAGTLPEGQLVPVPEPNDGHYYGGSALTEGGYYNKTVTERIWRWETTNECIDWDSAVDGARISCDDLRARVDAKKETVRACINQHLPAGHPKRRCYTHEEFVVEIWGYASWQEFVDEYISLSLIQGSGTVSGRIVKADGTGAIRIPTYTCFETETCELQANDTAETLEEHGLEDAAERARLAQIATDYTVSETLVVADRHAAHAAWRSDYDIITAHNAAVKAAYRAQKPEQVFDEERYNAAMAEYLAWKAEGKAAKDAYIAKDDAYRAAKASESGMYVDCTLNSGCVVMNPVR